ncbi:hypothetical protein [Saccharibacillus sacchari]|uniref:Uncharacterized protein n=1 Tax=Saccharibacillus sacchari TaxID=456493 RepID=A0ACC6PEV6_9BACL
MKPIEIPVRSTLQAFLRESEQIRMRRQQAIANPSHPSFKRFTQQELNDEACPTYKNWLIGRSARLPDRNTVLEIAAYLECDGEERNTLLLAADYIPEYEPLTGPKLEQALEVAHSLMDTLSVPALIATDDLRIKGFNESFIRLFDLSADLFTQQEVTMADLHFNPQLPVRGRSVFDAESFTLWEAHIQSEVHAWKQDPLLSRYGGHWIDRHRKYTEFNRYWSENKTQPPVESMGSKLWLANMEGDQELTRIRYRNVRMDTGTRYGLKVVAFLSVDDPARRVFERLAGSAAIHEKKSFPCVR